MMVPWHKGLKPHPQKQISVLKIDAWQTLSFYKNTRYYHLYLTQDLWGQWLIIRQFGHKNWQGGHEIKECFDHFKDAQNRLQELANIRIKRAYRPK